uniref:Putative structural protein n=1 Tax=viral metagenome TaxID=1070528 RepID=A0A6H1Z9X4_9ZZZZ
MAIQNEPVAHKSLVDGSTISLHSHSGGAGEAFPVGAVFLAVVSTNPNTLLGYGTWSQIANGKFLVGQDGTDEDFDTPEETGGSKTKDMSHVHSIDHSHTILAANLRTGGSSTETDASYTGSSGSGGSAIQNIVPPYFTVYIWKRTA